MVDTEEFRAHLSVKCSASATFRTEIGTSKAGSKETLYIVVQGDQANMISVTLQEKYSIPAKYIEVENKLPQKKKK